MDCNRFVTKLQAVNITNPLPGCILRFAEENNKSEPVPNRGNQVRIILLWCGQQDSNLHALAGEPKGDVTSVKV